jgi:hypothetical protein
VLGCSTDCTRRRSGSRRSISDRSRHKPLQPALVAERAVHGRWVFVNFHYGNDNSNPKNENLLSMLAVLRGDRTKGK